MTDDTDADRKVYRCWANGNGIQETILAVKRTTGVQMTFEEVRQRFVTLSEKFYG